MIAKYISPNNPYEYWEMSEYVSPYNYDMKYVDITYTNGLRSGFYAWIHLIKDGKIVWQQDNWLQMSEECMEYFQRMLKLTPFL